MKKILLLFIALLTLGLGSAQAQDNSVRTVTGTVVDEENVPLIGVSIFIEGTQTGVISDASGRFSIRVRPDQVLVFSYIGFNDLKERVGRRNTLNVTMYQKENELDQVVVIGYGKVKKSDLTGSATAVDMKNLKDIPITSVDHALQGRVAGADIMSTTGEPGATTSIRIRGTRSITATNEPLIVVDGVIDGINDLNDINSADIASVTVLKDASSTAIYGARGANGVIVITTKSGSSKKGHPDITFRADAGVSMLPSRIDIMNGTEFARFRDDLAHYISSDSWSVNDQSPLSSHPFPDPEKYGEGTDWVKEITRIAPYQNYNLSLSGQTDAGQYFASLGYNDNQGIIKNSGEQKWTMRLNLDRKLFDWMKVGVLMNYTWRNQKVNAAGITGTSWWSAAIFLNPLLSPTTDFNDLWYSGQKFNSPTILIENVDYYRHHQLMNDTAYLELTPLKGLVIKSQFTYKTYRRGTFYYRPGTLPAKKEGEGGDAERGEYNESTLSSDNTVSYTLESESGHHLNLLGGFVVTKNQSDNLYASGAGYTLDQLQWNNMQAIPDKQNLSVTTSNTLRIIESFLGRVDYNWKSRYYLTASFRYDGASNFASKKKWAFFPSAAFKWNIHNEPFMKGADRVNELALRLSAGRAGNNGISPYQSLARINSNASAYLFDSLQMGTYVDRLEASDLTWEITDTYNAALDMAFFDNRLNITAEAYYAKTKDLLLNVQVANQTGFSTNLANVGRTRNKGVELSIESYNILKPKFSWTTAFTISHNDQIVEDIGSEDFVDAYAPGAASGYRMYGYVKGYPLNALWGFQDAGVWHNQDEIDRNKITKAYASKYQSLGYSKYVDVNHDGVLNKDDLIYLGTADPLIYGGLQNTFNLYGFSLSLYFNYSLGGKIYHLAELYNGNGSQFTNQMRYMQNAWHPTRNPDSDIPRAGSYDQLPSTRILYDASYLRLKSASLGYTFDLRQATKGALRDLRLSVSGDNLYLWKYYAGFDPDVSTSSGGSTLRRIDNDAYPKARTVMFSLQLRY